MVERVAGIDIAWEQAISKYFFFCRRCGTLKRLEQKNLLHSSSDERSAIEHYFERGFRYDTIVHFLEKEVMKGLRFHVLIISRTSRFERTSFLLLNPYSRSLLFSLLVLSFIETPWYFSKNWTIHRRQNSSLLINSFPLLWHNISIHLVRFSPLAFWLQVDLVLPSASQCAVSWQSVDYWRKCQVTKYFSRSTKIFWILERFLDCKLFSISIKVICGYMN